jgi:hypothetical protein
MRELPRASQGAQSESPEALTARYESLLDEGLRRAGELAQAHKGQRNGLGKSWDTLFATRVAVLRQRHRFSTLNDRMPALGPILQRKRAEAASWNAERIANAFDLEGDRPADVKMNEASEAHRHLFGIETHDHTLTAAEADEFTRARRAVLEEIGCRFVFSETRTRYTNLLSFVKDDLVIHLTHDALPTKGLPNAERISGLTILGYVDGQARGHVVSFQRGRWDQRVSDARVQRTIDEIAAAVG